MNDSQQSSPSSSASMTPRSTEALQQELDDQKYGIRASIHDRFPGLPDAVLQEKVWKVYALKTKVTMPWYMDADQTKDQFVEHPENERKHACVLADYVESICKSTHERPVALLGFFRVHCDLCYQPPLNELIPTPALLFDPRPRLMKHREIGDIVVSCNRHS